MGTIKQDVPKEVTCTYINTGSSVCDIYDVEISCGCTGAKWSKRPIRVGEKEVIKVTYDAKESGKFIKTITVYGNLNVGSKQLQITGDVEE